MVKNADFHMKMLIKLKCVMIILIKDVNMEINVDILMILRKQNNIKQNQNCKIMEMVKMGIKLLIRS